MTDEQFLRLAIEQSALAAERGEYPYGAVLVHDDQVLLSGHNATQSTKDITAHAELLLIREAGQRLSEREVCESTLYSSCEPCAMCSGAIYWAGLRRVVYGCSTELDARISEMPYAIPCRTILNVSAGHSVDVQGPLLEDEAAAVLRQFWPQFLSSHSSSFGLSV